MEDRKLYRRIISGDAGGWAMPLRGGLRALEGLYAILVKLRNRRYDREGSSVVLPVPVVSVGNITAGGTGKTPFVMEVVRRLEQMGRSPAVVARGYKAREDEPNDEQRLIQKHHPGVAYVADADRGRAGEVAWRKCGADVIVLDDGFQHRRLGRKLDIVLVDATCPFGFDHLLPRGLLREPIGGLWRADLVVITRSDQVSSRELALLDKRLRSIADKSKHLKCNHRVTGIERLDGTTIGGEFEGRRAVVFGGIGNPHSFRATVRLLGFDIVGEKWWPDHHVYRRRDLDSLLASGRFPPHDMLLTTEKDAVKLAEMGGLDHARIGVVPIDIDFLDDGGTILQKALEQLPRPGAIQ